MGSSVYHIRVCNSVAEPACKNSTVCLVSGSGSQKSAVSFGLSSVMKMDFKHEEQAVLMQYGGGDPCPPGLSATLDFQRLFKAQNRASSAFFGSVKAA